MGHSDSNAPLMDAIREFAQGRAQTPDDDAIWIFWEVQQSLSAGSARTDDAALKCLESLYKKHRVSYRPDDDKDNLVELLTFLHIAAARAFKVQQCNGRSEEVTDCLTEVERAMELLSLECPGSADPPDLTEGFASLISAVATSGIVFVELSRVCRSERRYADALKYLNRATRYYDEAAICSTIDWGPGHWEDNYEVEMRMRRRLEGHLGDLEVSLEDARGLFDEIKANHRRVGDWSKVAEDCRALMNANWVSGIRDEFRDEHGDLVGWQAYWNGAQTWARARISPTELQELQARHEEEAARRRIRLYFFSETWDTLTSRAQAAIVNADLHMHSRERGLRLDAALNELRIATEETFNQNLWEPLATVGPAEWFPELDEFEERKEFLRSQSHEPGLRDFEWACRRPFFRMFLETRALEPPDIEFLTQDFPKLCRSLRKFRNVSEHRFDTVLSRKLVDFAFREFLGSGRKGVLPELARIGRKTCGDGQR